MNNYSIPNIVLKSALSLRDDRLNICHVNVGSVFPKIDELRVIFDNCHCHVIFFSETWLKSTHSNIAVHLDDFNIIRNDRFSRRGGGVAAYIKKGIKFKTIFSSEKIGSEILLIELIFPTRKVLVGVIYKAPNVDEVGLLSDLLSNLTSKYDDVIITGDFNENMLMQSNGYCLKCIRRTCSICRFSAMISSFNLCSVGQYATHFSPLGRPSLIDLVLTSDISKMLFFNQVSTGLSDHDLIFCSYECQIGEVRSSKKFARRLNSIVLTELLSDALNLDFDVIYNHSSIDVMLHHFNSLILFLLNKHAPLRPIVKRLPKHASWFTPEIKQSIIERNLARICYRRTMLELDFNRYKALRNKVISLIRLANLIFINLVFHFL